MVVTTEDTLTIENWMDWGKPQKSCHVSWFSIGVWNRCV